MSNNTPTPAVPPSGAIVLPTIATHASFWDEKKRRPVFLIILMTGLAVFLIWLPAGARAALFSGLSTQHELVIMLGLFGLVTVSLVWSAGQRLDARVFMLFNTQAYPKWLDRVMWMATQLGNMLAAIIVAALLFILNYRRMAFEVVFGTFTLWLLVEIIKVLSDRDRPFLVFDTARVIGWKEKGDSFPSGHTTQIFFLVTLFTHRFQLGAGSSIILYAIAALVGFTRIYVGAHYPRDVVAGVVLGSVWGILAMLVNPY